MMYIVDIYIYKDLTLVKFKLTRTHNTLATQCHIIKRKLKEKKMKNDVVEYCEIRTISISVVALQQ